MRCLLQTYKTKIYEAKLNLNYRNKLTKLLELLNQANSPLFIYATCIACININCSSIYMEVCIHI